MINEKNEGQSSWAVGAVQWKGVAAGFAAVCAAAFFVGVPRAFAPGQHPSMRPDVAVQNPDISLPGGENAVDHEFEAGSPDAAADGEPSKPQQSATFREDQHFSSENQPIVEIRVRSEGGDISVHRSSQRGISVWVEKSVTAGTYGEAREFSRQLHYELKREGEVVSVVLSHPSGVPPSISRSHVSMFAFVPYSVKVITN